MNVNGKNAIVTGGSSGIGYQLVKELLLQGVQVVGIFDLIENATGLKQLKNEFTTKTIEFYKTDVRCQEEIKKSFEEFTSAHQFIDILINSAGIANENKAGEVVLVNLLGLMNCTYEAINFMSISRNGRGGLIINLASICSILHLPFLPYYNASKHGVLAFTRTMANGINTKLHGVKFFALCPGVTETKLTSNLPSLFRSEFAEEGVKYVKTVLCTQTVEQLGACFRQILPIAQNGSAWIITKGHFTEYTPDDFDPEYFVKSK